MARPDLLALTPEGIAALTLLGYVKRAQKEIAAGQGPALAEEPDGTVVGTFPDGVVARLVPGKTFKETPCTCGAMASSCRHRVATALAYPEWYEERVSRSRRVSAPDPTWTPAATEDAEVEALIGKRAMERARAARASGLVVTVVPPSEGEPPTARLPSCSVRFLVPRDLAYARCDCALGTACEHVALAVWAFRAAGPLEGAARTISLGHDARAKGAVHAALDEATELVGLLLDTGIANLTPAVAARFAKARAALEEEGLVWPAGVVDDLERMLEAYAARSARYSSREVLDLATELEARARAAKAGKELPARFVLGEDEVRETQLDHVRLVSLGARVLADGPARDAEVFLADLDSAMVLVLQKRWTEEDGKPEDGPTIARRAIAPRVSLGALAHGQMVSKVVRRRANRAITLGKTRTAQTSVTPQTGAWADLPPPLRVDALADLGAHMRAAPPRALRPRVLCEGMHALRVGAVIEVGYVPAEQELWAVVADGAGDTLRVSKRYKAVAPHALEATAEALAKGPAFLAGEIELGHRGLEMDPVGIVVGDRVVVPDLAASAPALEVPRFTSAHAPEPLHDALSLAAGVLEEGAHLGLSRAPQEWAARVVGAADRAGDVGLEGLARPLRALAAARTDPRAARMAWLDAAVRLALTRELAP